MNEFSVTHEQKNLVVPLEYTEIPVCFFRGILNVKKSSVETIHLHKYIAGVHYNAFDELYNLRSITVDPQNSIFQSEDGILYLKDRLMIKRYPPMKKDVRFELPIETQYLENCTFSYNKYLEEVKLNGNIDSIPTSAFSHCTNLQKVVVPRSIDEIQKNAFAKNENMKSLFVAGTISYVYGTAFSGCENLTIYCRPSKQLENQQKWNRHSLADVKIRKWDGRGVKMPSVCRTDASIEDRSCRNSIRKGLEIFSDSDSVKAMPPFAKIEASTPIYIGKFANGIYYKTTNIRKPFICTAREAYQTLAENHRNGIKVKGYQAEIQDLKKEAIQQSKRSTPEIER